MDVCVDNVFSGRRVPNQDIGKMEKSMIRSKKTGIEGITFDVMSDEGIT